MNPDQFVEELAKHNLSLSKNQVQQFKIYFKYLVAVNLHLNLTRITAEDEVYLKHFYDSITPLFVLGKVFKEKVTLCDVGAGAGFPSLPLKIVRPDLQVTIVDSLAKRLNFLKQLLAKLGIGDVKLIHGRAEDVGQNKIYRAHFDLVTARAVARMPVLSEYCLPLVKQGGYFVALKGPKAHAELQASQKALQVLGGKLVRSYAISLAPGEQRNLILIAKTKATPRKYPRQAGKPNRKPIS